ncbi:MAG: hypothetical protein ACO1NY_04965 [Pseudorhodoplanes sp.]
MTMETLASLNESALAFETALENSLPAIYIVLSLMTLSGNFAIKSFFDSCGLDLYGRISCGLAIGIAGLVLATGLSSCHATTAMIAMFIFLGGMALRGGARQVAAINVGAAAVLAPVVIVP